MAKVLRRTELNSKQASWLTVMTAVNASRFVLSVSLIGASQFPDKCAAWVVVFCEVLFKSRRARIVSGCPVSCV